jgi:hypothetical protein
MVSSEECEHKYVLKWKNDERFWERVGSDRRWIMDVDVDDR